MIQTLQHKRDEKGHFLKGGKSCTPQGGIGFAFCIRCGNVYVARKIHLPKRKFCSRKCKSLDWVEKRKNSVHTPEIHARIANSLRGHKRPNMTGEQHFAWKGGITPINEKIRKSIEYKQWRGHVFKRDNYTCQSCKQYGGALQADHELPFAFYPDLRFEILNGRTLCKPCHLRTPTWGGHKGADTS